MEWYEIFGLTTVSSTVLLSAIAFMCKKWFIARITESIKHEYAKELESHRNNLRRETDTELTRLNGNVAVEVEKAKLKLSFYSEKQFELYNELWLNLCELRIAMNDLWNEVNSDNLWDFQEKLIKSYDMLEQKALLIEPRHYDELRGILNEFGNYQMGKDSLLKLRREQKRGREIPEEQVEQMVFHNMDSRGKLLNYLEQMRNCLRSQISGHKEN